MIKNILWDFDGVILDSMFLRDYGFRKIFEHYPHEKVEQLIIYHRENGGLSRFHKIKYFYEKILCKNIQEQEIKNYAEKFSQIMKNELIDPANLIVDTIEFIKNNYEKFNFHIVSGSEHKELNYLCGELKIKKYFIDINGSPTPKDKLVNLLIKNNQYKREETILIGDSINDYEASTLNNISFYGYNNVELKIYENYIDTFKEFDI